MAKTGGQALELRSAQQRAADYRKLNQDLNVIVKTTALIAETLDTLRDITPSAIYNYGRKWQREALTITSAEIDTAVFPEIPSLVSKLRKEVRDLAESLILSRLLLVIPRSYQEFREKSETQARFFAAATEKAIRDRQLSEPEEDVILYHTLELTRQLRSEIPGDLAGVPDEFRSLLTRFRLFITVDEATDFSPLELACIERFALPEGGVTISGDLMQRVTETGLREWSDMASICRAYSCCELKVSYRQTERLFRIARDLYKYATGNEPKFKSAYPSRPEDPPALSFKSGKDESAPRWLVDRICDIFVLGNNHLPTTAILVPTPADVEPLKAAIHPLLHENGIELDASQGGQNLGDSARVRIFPVEQIKGLEFEAAFYVGIDRMAEIHKDLIDKYVYVGLSRARSFLGVTFERQFPLRLKCIEPHFQQGGSWSRITPTNGIRGDQHPLYNQPAAAT
jgi:DNA helicase IV